MAQVEETIPKNLAAPAEAARAWFSQDSGSEFKLTGIVDPEDVVVSDSGPIALQLILCGSRDGQDVCLKERFDVTPSAGSFDVSYLKDSEPEIGSPAPLMDPPVGIREDWVENILPKHKFIVLVFYRGFW